MDVKHFIAFATLGIAAIGSGMALASHISMPEPAPTPAAPRVQSPAYSSSSLVPNVDLPALPAMPRTLPDPQTAVEGAGRAFGKATDTMAYYSDRTFGPAAMKVKRSVDEARVPTLH